MTATLDDEPTPEQEAACERAMAGMEAQADIWAEEVNLTSMIKNVSAVGRLKTGVPPGVREGFVQRMESQFDAIARQCFLEGWLRSGLSRQDHDAAEIARLRALLEPEPDAPHTRTGYVTVDPSEGEQAKPHRGPLRSRKSLTKPNAPDPVSKTARRCAEIAREQAKAFLSPEYATGQPLSSLSERHACEMVALGIEREFGLPTSDL